MLWTILIVAATALQAYLLGSVDTGILVSRLVYHDDVRNHGSGAAGMTNMLRTFGKKAAAMTAIGDVLKGDPREVLRGERPKRFFPRFLIAEKSGPAERPWLGRWFPLGKSEKDKPSPSALWAATSPRGRDE